jgi:hypothetical protein
MLAKSFLFYLLLIIYPLTTNAEVLNQLWEEEIEQEENLLIDFSSLLRSQSNFKLKNFSHLPSAARKAMLPYLLPIKHPLYKVLDSIFLKVRATVDSETFYQTGFRTIAEGPRSYILVAKHKKLPGHLVKAFLDTELREKYDKQSWEWLVNRCKGAMKIRKIIKEYGIRHFVVPDKWIYCLPSEPSPPQDSAHTRHLAILLVTDMKLASEKHNEHAWSHYITEEHLDELFEIISRAKGSSYRPDNIAYTKNGKFAFIDTEYPTHGPDFKSIRPYLNWKMRHYWDSLVKQRGY